MKIKFEEDLLYEISETEIKSLCNKINKKNLQKEIKRKITDYIKNFCDQSFEDLKKYWMPIIFSRYESIPTSKEKLINLIISQPDYSDEYFNQVNTQMKNDESFKIT